MQQRRDYIHFSYPIWQFPCRLDHHELLKRTRKQLDEDKVRTRSVGEMVRVETQAVAAENGRPESRSQEYAAVDLSHSKQTRS